MITATATAVLSYSSAVIGVALLVWLLCPRRFAARRVALRITVVFGVFALAAAYVRLDLGPEIDARFIQAARPWVMTGDPGPIDI